MKPLPGTIHGGKLFAQTHWSQVLTAAQTDGHPDKAAEALAALCETYWAPLYSFVRGLNYSAHDAEDLTQGFFSHLIEREFCKKADPQKGKFRSYLLGAIKNYLSDVRSHERTQKRGGSFFVTSLEELPATELETLCAAPEPSGAERIYEETWARSLVDAALNRVSADYEAEGKAGLFAQLQPFIAGDQPNLPAYDGLASSLGVPAATLRSHVTRLRVRYREALRAEVRRTVASAREVEGELQELIRVLTDVQRETA